MRFRTGRIPRALGVLLLPLCVPALPLTAAPPDPVSAWVNDLRSADFQRRHTATIRLQQAGIRAISPLCEAARTDDAETAYRAVRILGRCYASEDPATSEAAEEALRTLATGRHRHATRQARQMLTLFRPFPDDRIARMVLRLGGSVEIAAADPRNTTNLPLASAIEDELSPLPSLMRTPVADAARLPAGEYRLVSINLFGCREITADQLAGFRRLRSLRTLILSRTPVDDTALGDLARIPNLKYLDLRETGCTPEAVAKLKAQDGEGLVIRGDDAPQGDLEIAEWVISAGGRVQLVSEQGQAWRSARSACRLPPLEDGECSIWRIDLSRNPHLRDDDLACLAQLPHLQQLALAGTNITDAGLKHLCHLPNLQWLDLSDTRLSDAGLKSLEGLRALTYLYLSRTQVTGAGLTDMNRFPRLEVLWLNGSRVDNAGLARLRELPELWWLNLESTRIGDAGLAELAGIPQLHSLNLKNTYVTDAGLTRLRGLSRLQSVSLTDTGVTEQGVRKLHDALPDVSVTMREERR